MQVNHYTPGRILLGRVLYDEDLVEAVQRFCHENNVALGLVSAVGAVKSATVGYYDQSAKRYPNLLFDEPAEIVSCVGNISIRDGRPMLHAHIALSSPTGEMRAGHLLPGTMVFACEISIQELVGPPLERGHDDVTGLPLWPMK